MWRLLLAVLMCWVLVVAEAQVASDYLVQSLPGLPAPATNWTHYAGEVVVNATSNATFFFWFFPKEGQTFTASTPTVLSACEE